MQNETNIHVIFIWSNRQIHNPRSSADGIFATGGIASFLDSGKCCRSRNHFIVGDAVSTGPPQTYTSCDLTSGLCVTEPNRQSRASSRMVPSLRSWHPYNAATPAQLQARRLISTSSILYPRRISIDEASISLCVLQKVLSGAR